MGTLARWNGIATLLHRHPDRPPESNERPLTILDPAVAKTRFRISIDRKTQRRYSRTLLSSLLHQGSKRLCRRFNFLPSIPRRMTSNDTVQPYPSVVTPKEGDGGTETTTKQQVPLTRVSKAGGTASSSNPRLLTTRVSFNQIEIREYARCMGDNPATTHGPPLSIDWDYNVAGTYAVDEYEDTRPPRRVSQEFCVPRAIREDILLTHTDVSKKEMKKAVAEIRTIRQRRITSVAFQELEDYHRFGEFIARRFRRWRSGISKQREQELLWENAQRVLEVKSADSKSDDSKSVDSNSAHSKSKTKRISDEGPPSDDGSTLDTAELTRYSSTSSIVGIEDVDPF